MIHGSPHPGSTNGMEKQRASLARRRRRLLLLFLRESRPERGIDEDQ